MGEDTASLLTGSQREWLAGESTPAKTRNMRARVYDRMRAAIREDGELVADALEKPHSEDGWLDAEPVADDFDFQELGEGISGLVAALYMIGDAVDMFDAEKAIQEGIARGKKGRIAAIKQKLDDDPRRLTLGEWDELRENTDMEERADMQVMQEIGPVDWYGPIDESELPDDLED
jgi:hypothetical protein